MAAAAVPVVGQIIASVVVSQVASGVASSIGLSDSMADLVGIGAGLYAGSMIPGGIGTGPGSTPEPTAPTVGADLSLNSGAGGLDLAMNSPSLAPSSAAPSMTVGSTPGASDGLAIGDGGGLARSSGMLNEAAQSSVADDVIKSPTVKQATDGGTETSWWEKLFSSDKTLDLTVAGLGGYAKAAAAQEDREYEQKQKDQAAATWDTSAARGSARLLPSYPSRGGIS